MVAETTEAPVVTEETVPTAEPVEATPETPTPEPEAQQPDADPAGDFLRERGLVEPEAGEEPKSPYAWIDGLPEEQQKEARELVTLREQVEEGRKLSQSQVRRDAFVDHVSRLDYHLKQVAAGQVELNPQLVVDHFKAYHDVSSRLAQAEAAEPFVAHLEQEAVKLLPAAERQPFQERKRESAAELVKDIVETARKGYHTDAQLKKEIAKAVNDHVAWLQEKPERIDALMSKTRAPNVNGGGSSGGTPTFAEWNSWTLEKREEARRRDPSIEMKITR